MASLKVSTLRISDTVFFPHLDTGAASGPTYLLVPGLGFTCETYRQLINAKPDSARIIAYTPRGFSGAAPFDKGVDPAIQLGQDLVAILAHINQPVHLLAWSAGNRILTSLFSLQNEDAPSSYAQTLDHIKSVVLWESTNPSLGLPSSATEQYFFARMQEEGPKATLDYASGMWNYDEPVQQLFAKNRPRSDEVLHPVSSLTHNPDFLTAYIAPCTEPAVMEQYMPTALMPGPESSAITERFYQHISKRPVVGIVSLHSMPECIAATIYVVTTLEEMGANAQLRVLPGPYNHFAHNTAPNEFWQLLQN